MDADRWQRLAPWLAAVAAAATVALVLLPAQTGGTTGPVPPAPVRPAPEPLDRLGQSLDRCAAALEGAGLTDRYPERAGWRPLAQLFTTDGRAAALLDADVPFVCATGPALVEVSDPQAAVPIDRALVVLTSPDGVLAGVAPDGMRIEVTADGGRPSGLAAHRNFIRLAAGPISDAGGLAVAIGDSSGIHQLGAPERLAPPAVRVVDRQSVPADGSGAAADLLRRCSAQTGADASPDWTTVQVLSHRRDDRPASLLVAARPSMVGGCSVAPGEVTPLLPWGAGVADGDARPFVWLALPPDLAAGVVAGAVRPEVVRMEVAAGAGRPWRVSVAGGTFAGQVPPDSPADPRVLTVRAFDADGALLYEGPAVG